MRKQPTNRSNLYTNIVWADTTAVASPIVPTEPTNGLAGMSTIQMYDRYRQYRKLHSGATAVEIVTYMKKRPRLPENKRNAVDRLTYWLEDNGGGYVTMIYKTQESPLQNLSTKPIVHKHYSPEDVVRITKGGEINAQFKLFVKHRQTNSQPGLGLRRGNINQYGLHSFGIMESLPACCGCVVISNVSKHKIFQDYLMHLAFTMNYGIALCSDVVSEDKYVHHEWKTIKVFDNPRTSRALTIKTIDLKKIPPIIHHNTSVPPWVARQQNLSRKNTSLAF